MLETKKCHSFHFGPDLQVIRRTSYSVRSCPTERLRLISQAITSTLPRRTRDPLNLDYRGVAYPRQTIFTSQNDAFQIGTRVDYSPTPVIVVITTRVASSSATRACREMPLGVPSRRRMTIPSARRVSRPRILPKKLRRRPKIKHFWVSDAVSGGSVLLL
jgi:hypothetical protein